MKKANIDINCDVGEGIGNEPELFPLISSCNIACGGHAGSKESIRACLKLAKRYNVRIGAHPSYPDKNNFGRLSMNISGDALITSIQDQIHLFLSECEQLGVSLHHIKPHGALYNDIAKDEKKAKIFLKAIAPYKDKCCLYVPHGSVIEALATSHNYTIVREAFADRNYNSDLSLVSRNEKNAMLLNPEDVLEHILLMFKVQKVKSITGEKISIVADTFCVHGDTPAAFQILAYITNYFREHNL